MSQIARAAAILAALAAGGALAQGAGPPREEARSRQAAIYERLLRNPADPDLMAAYARASVDALDYEAAISTLERALVFRPDSAALRLELGAAYFRIGAWQAAEAYFLQAREAGLPPEDDARAEEFLAAIARRTATSRFSGSVLLGGVLSTNANVGPDDRIIRFFGVPAAIDAGETARSDGGVRLLADIRHDYDLGRPNDDVWRTEASLYAVRFFEEDAGNTESVVLSTGPNLSLDDEAYGAKIRPFVGVRAARQDDSNVFQEIGVGAGYTETLSPDWSLFGRAGVGYRNYREESDDFDAVIARGVAGAGYAVTEDLTVFALALAETDRADSDAQSNFEIGGRLAASVDYDPRLAEAGGPWTLSAFAQVTGRWYDEADPVVDPDTKREDVDLRFGAAHRIRLKGGWGVQVDVDTLIRQSNIENFELDSLNGALSVVYEF